MAAPKRITEQEKEIRRLAGMIRSETALAEAEGLPPKTDLAKYAHVGAMQVILKIITGEIPLPATAKDAIAVAEGMFKIARVMEGLPTNITAQPDKAEVKAWVEQMKTRQKANES